MHNAQRLLCKSIDLVIDSMYTNLYISQHQEVKFVSYALILSTSRFICIFSTSVLQCH